MRNQHLTGYLLHHKPYQESRALYYFFTPTHGVVHGIGKKGLPLFALMQLFATGKRSLKSFSQIQPASLVDFESTAHDLDNIHSKHKDKKQCPELTLTELLSKGQNELAITETVKPTASIDTSDAKFKVVKRLRSLTGHNLYAGFYLNEILWKLLETEDSMPKLWEYYRFTLERLSVSVDSVEMKLLLRHFELVLFEALGHGFSFREDNQGSKIKANLHYYLLANEGFQPIDESQKIFNKNKEISNVEAERSTNSFASMSIFSGVFLCTLVGYLQADNQSALSKQTLEDWSRLHKQMVDCLLDYQLLNSRELWIQFMRYQ